jgi:hypothetical protein
VLPLGSVGVDLVLLRSDEAALVYVRMDFDVRVIAELESILYQGTSVRKPLLLRNYMYCVRRN